MQACVAVLLHAVGPLPEIACLASNGTFHFVHTNTQAVVVNKNLRGFIFLFNKMFTVRILGRIVVLPWWIV